MEVLVVGAPEFFPPRDVSDVHAGPGDVREVGAQFAQRFAHDIETAARLRFPDLQDADQVFLRVMQDLFPPMVRGLAVAARRGFGVVVGSPYPALSDQVVRNALTLHHERRLGGLTLVFVSAKPPSKALWKAATNADARLHHREFR